MGAAGCAEWAACRIRVLSTAQSWPKTSVFPAHIFSGNRSGISLTLLHEGNTMRDPPHYSLPSLSWFCRRIDSTRSIDHADRGHFERTVRFDGKWQTTVSCEPSRAPWAFLIDSSARSRTASSTAARKRGRTQFAADRRKHSGRRHWRSVRRGQDGIKGICSWNRYAERHRFWL